MGRLDNPHAASPRMLVRQSNPTPAWDFPLGVRSINQRLLSFSVKIPQERVLVLAMRPQELSLRVA